ncbi:hypothetical protein NC652_014643 [Populus alba x Populus x berolinensis]|nr:hypothetical protein NC652_014643 [Populus alba x Populus x berolinensis]
MNEHKRWETILVHPADSKPYNKSLVKALFIIKVYDASIYIRGNHDLLPALQFFKHSCLRLPFRTLKSSSGPHMANLLPDWISVLCLSFLSFCPQMPSLMIVPHTVIRFLCLCGHAYSC